MDTRASIHWRFCGPTDVCNPNARWQGLKFHRDCNTRTDFGLPLHRRTCPPPPHQRQPRKRGDPPPRHPLRTNGYRTPPNSCKGKSTRASKPPPCIRTDDGKWSLKTTTIKTIAPDGNAGTSSILRRLHPKTAHRHTTSNIHINRPCKSPDPGIPPLRRGTPTPGTDSRTNSPCATIPARWWRNERHTLTGCFDGTPFPHRHMEGQSSMSPTPEQRGCCTAKCYFLDRHC